MDIFTTQLTRVVPVPIRAETLKVKALLKEAATSKLKEDPDHLENHDYYIFSTDDENNNTQQNLADPRKKAKQAKSNEEEKEHDSDRANPPHLDIYV